MFDKKSEKREVISKHMKMDDSQQQQNKKGVVDSIDMVMKGDEEMNNNKMFISSSCGSRIIIVMRLVGMTLALAAAVVAGTNNESQIISFTLVTGLPPLHIPYTAKWHYLSSIVYFVAINAIACIYSAASIVFLVASRRQSSAETALLPLLMADVIMVALLFSAIGAAAAVGLIGVNGNSHTQWHKVCYMFTKYCHYGEAAVIISMLGALVFLSLVVLATLKLHKKSSW